MRSENKVVPTRAAKAHARHVTRTEARRIAKCKMNWQKEWKNLMLQQRGMNKIMSLIGRGIAVQKVKNAKAGV